MAKQYLFERGVHNGKQWELYRWFDHYALYVDGEFWCTCESIREFRDELEEV